MHFLYINSLYGYRVKNSLISKHNVFNVFDVLNIKKVKINAQINGKKNKKADLVLFWFLFLIVGQKPVIYLNKNTNFLLVLDKNRFFSIFRNLSILFKGVKKFKTIKSNNSVNVFVESITFNSMEIDHIYKFLSADIITILRDININFEFNFKYDLPFPVFKSFLRSAGIPIK